MNNKYKRKRKAIIGCVLEGKNKTERNYLKHFKSHDTNYALHLIDSDQSDLLSMANKAVYYYKEYQMSNKYNDHMFCIFDLDLDEQKYNKLLELKGKTKYKNIEFIVSNPCFEVWLMYHLDNNPKKANSSQKVKENMNTYMKNYSENIDVYTTLKLECNINDAIINSKKKNKLYEKEKITFIDRNPYTEFQNVIETLYQLKKEA